jgi:hypothetical protein
MRDGLYVATAEARAGTSSHVRPSSSRPDFFFLVPPQCSKRKVRSSAGIHHGFRNACCVHRASAGAGFSAHNNQSITSRVGRRRFRHPRLSPWAKLRKITRLLPGLARVQMACAFRSPRLRTIPNFARQTSCSLWNMRRGWRVSSSPAVGQFDALAASLPRQMAA